jgi:hypothetical protein
MKLLHSIRCHIICHIICEHQKSRILKFLTYKFISTCYTFHNALVHMHAHTQLKRKWWVARRKRKRQNFWNTHHQCSAPWSHPLSSADWKPKFCNAHHQCSALCLPNWAELIESQNFETPITSIQCTFRPNWADLLLNFGSVLTVICTNLQLHTPKLTNQNSDWKHVETKCDHKVHTLHRMSNNIMLQIASWIRYVLCCRHKTTTMSLHKKWALLKNPVWMPDHANGMPLLRCTHMTPYWDGIGDMCNPAN